MGDILLTVSGVIDRARQERAIEGRAPRTDYGEIARALGADLLDYEMARRRHGAWGRLLEGLGGPALLLAWAVYRVRHRYRILLTDGEQVGIPLACLLKLGGRGRRGARHLMIVHTLLPRKKRVFFDVLGIQSAIDTFLVYSTWQQHFIRERWRIAATRVLHIPFMVDTRFFAPELVDAGRPQPLARTVAAAPGRARMPRGNIPRLQSDHDGKGYFAGDRRPLICAVGLECRDYPTLIRAVRDLPVRVVIAASSPWSRRADTTQQVTVPENVTVAQFDLWNLRRLYAQSRLMVMPLYKVYFQAGVTALLEAMAMALPIICSRVPGQTDVVVEGETGLYVPPGDPSALRAAIVRLLADPAEAERMGRAGRERVVREMSLDGYVTRLRGVIEGLLEGE